MVRDVFRLAKENAPAIIFIDEVDAIATARFDAQTGADREVQRILMELLNQMDGFDQTVNVKVGGKRPEVGVLQLLAKWVPGITLQYVLESDCECQSTGKGVGQRSAYFRLL
jgi:SpoVK/Ycf46/Vps4 family AAA+-type ATPase